MKIELTQKELVAIVRKHYNLANTLDLEVSVESAVDTSPKKTTKDDTADLLEDVNPKKKRKYKKHAKRRYTPAGEAAIRVPKNPKIDYAVYGEAIEEFLKSGKDFAMLPMEDGLKNSGLLYRYRTAAEMFGFREKIALNAPKRHSNELIISLPGKGPIEYRQDKSKAYIK